MNTILKCCALLTITLLVSCKEEKKMPKVIYDESKSNPIDVKNIDTTSSLNVADLPVHMEGTSYLIYPVGDVVLYENNSRSYSTSKSNQMSYAISNYNRFELTGYFDNLKFQHIDSTTVNALTDKKVQIQTVTFLDAISAKYKNQILVYTLVDNDTNRDGKIDQNDIKSLYISNANGSKFTKLSEPLQELIDWNIIEIQNKLYFRCIEDINKNGAIDKNDKVHYHVVNLATPDWKVEEYMPI
jgi:hypothetical protein